MKYACILLLLLYYTYIHTQSHLLIRFKLNRTKFKILDIHFFAMNSDAEKMLFESISVTLS